VQILLTAAVGVRVPDARLVLRGIRHRVAADRVIRVRVVAVIGRPRVTRRGEDRRRMHQSRSRGDIQRAAQIPLSAIVITEFAGAA